LSKQSTFEVGKQQSSPPLRWKNEFVDDAKHHKGFPANQQQVMMTAMEVPVTPYDLQPSRLDK